MVLDSSHIHLRNLVVESHQLGREVDEAQWMGRQGDEAVLGAAEMAHPGEDCAEDMDALGVHDSEVHDHQSELWRPYPRSLPSADSVRVL